MGKRLNEREGTERERERFKKTVRDKRPSKIGDGEWGGGGAKADNNEEGVSGGDLN